jgi:transcriptional regulator with XRE-family HTH domain
VPPRRRHQSAASILARRVQALRQARGWSQETLAEHADIDRSYLAGIETAARNPSLKVLERLAQGLGVQLGELFEARQAGLR